MSADTISVNVEQDRAAVTLHGEHEAYTADKLARHLFALLAQRIDVTVDLRQALFIDSTVVGVLIEANKRAQEAQVELTLVVGDETGWPVRRLLDVTGLGAQLVIVE